MPHNEPTVMQLLYGLAATLLGWVSWQWRRISLKLERIDRNHVTRQDLHDLMEAWRAENNAAHRLLHERLDKLVDKLIK